MEDLPIDIERKLETLPTISFDDTQALQNVLVSQDFTDIYSYYEANYLPEEIKSKSELYKRLALYLTITNQDTSLVDKIDTLLYRRPVPTIEEFLSGKFYMYNSNATLYPYWRQQLEYMFREGSPIRKTIFGGSIGCLTDDTVIATLNGDKTIKELLNNYEDEWVLSFNTQNKSWEPDKIIDVFSSGIQDVYEITLDNNETIKCTSDHRFLTRHNKWMSIDTGLSVGTSMMPYYYQISENGYVQVKNNNTEKWEKRYLIVSKWKTSYKPGQVTHHKNFKKYDDRPSNLAVIPHKYHWEYHARLGGRRWKEYNASIRGDEFKEYRRQKGLKASNTYKARPDYEEIEAKRKVAWNKLHQNSEHQRNAALACWNNQHSEEYRKRAAKTLTERNKTEKARNTSRQMAENMRNLKANKSPEEKAIIMAKQTLATVARFHGKENQKYIELLAFIHTKEPWYDPSLGAKENHKRKKIYNHKIVAIKYIGQQQVYDITTERNHNFALKAGIIAHNCGKSTVARKAFVYVLYRILCLRDARAAFNIDKDATIANVIISMTLKQVYETNLLPFIKLMETMPCFQRVMRMQSFENFDLSDPRCPIPFSVERSTGTIYFPDNIIMTCGSGITHTIGLNIVNSFCFTGAMKVYTDKGILSFIDLYRQFNKGIKFSTYSINSEDNEEETEIANVKITGYKQNLIRIYYDDIKYIECTPEHLFVIKNSKLNDQYIIYENNISYKQAQYLTKDDLTNINIKKIEKIHLEVPVPVYDLTVTNKNHNFALAIDNGMSVYVHNCDEINEKGVDEALALLNSIDNRFSSRFQGSPLVFQSVVSSARTTNSPIGEYIRRLPKNDPSILSLHPCLWEVKVDPEFLGDGSTFDVLVGNGSVPSKIFTDPGELKAIEDGNYTPPPGCEVIHVPTVYKSKFELQLEQSIQDIAGMTTVDNSMVFRDVSKLEDSELFSEIEIKADLNENVDILAQLDQYNLWTKDLKGKYLFRRAPNALRYCHVDLSASGSNGQCDTGLCIGHKEWKLNEETGQKDTVYVVDLIMAISAKNKIDIHSIETFLVNLVTERDMQIHTVSSDQWNGEIFQQHLTKSGCFTEVKKVSVDVKLEPYTNASALIEQGLVKVGTCPKLKKELTTLVFDKGKVTKTTELKDMSDSLCGFIYNAQLNYSDFPQYEYKNNSVQEKFTLNYDSYISNSEELVDFI